MLFTSEVIDVHFNQNIVQFQCLKIWQMTFLSNIKPVDQLILILRNGVKCTARSMKQVFLFQILCAEYIKIS